VVTTSSPLLPNTLRILVLVEACNKSSKLSNGDGLDDLIVGAKNAKVGKEYSVGKSYVVFGKQDNTNAINLSDIAHNS
jgi:hypothetical protein